MAIQLRPPIQWFRWIVSNTKRLLVLVVGTALVGAGLAMLILPGPGILISVVGLAVLATEFAWAERALDRSKAKAIGASNSMAASTSSRIAFGASAVGLIVGGAIAAALSSKYRVIGISALLAGVTAAAVLLPQTRRWLNAHMQPTRSESELTGQSVTKTSSSAPTRDLKVEELQ